MKKLALIASLIFTLALSFQFAVFSANAAGKVDCGQVMSELSSGKKVAEVAKDMGVSKRSVRRCRRQGKMEPKTSGMGTMATPSAMESPAAAAPETR
jgi:hypothetical protein